MKPTEKTKKNSSKVSSRLSLGERVPKLRFPGFEGEWVAKSLRNECTFYSGGTPDSTNKEFYNGNIPFIRSAEIDKSVTQLFLTEKGLNGSSAKLVGIGDLLLALYGANSGEVAISRINGAINQAILCIRSNTVNINFLKYLLERDKASIINRYLQGGQGNLSAEIIKELNFYFPNRISQDKITHLLEMVEKRLAAQRKLVELLKKHKRGLLREVFEENNEGNYRPFSEIAKRRNDKIAPMPDSTLKCIELEHIEPETGRIIGSVPLKRQTSLKNFCRPDDIIFGKLRPYLRKFAFAEDDSAASSETWVLVAVKDILPRFLFYLIQSEPFMRAASVSSGTKMPRSEWSNVAGARFRIPDERRQCIIAESFSLFDKRIQESQLIAEAMERVKRGLLQALFV